MRHRLTLLNVLVLALVVMDAHLLLAQAATVADKTGIFGPVLDKFWPVLETALTSATLWVVARYNAFTRTLPMVVKWALLYFIALGYNLLAHQLGWASLDPQAPLFSLPLATGGAAALIYAFGGHKVPDVAKARGSLG